MKRGPGGLESMGSQESDTTEQPNHHHQMTYWEVSQLVWPEVIQATAVRDSSDVREQAPLCKLLTSLCWVMSAIIPLAKGSPMTKSRVREVVYKRAWEPKGMTYGGWDRGGDVNVTLYWSFALWPQWITSLPHADTQDPFQDSQRLLWLLQKDQSLLPHNMHQF